MIIAKNLQQKVVNNIAAKLTKNRGTSDPLSTSNEDDDNNQKLDELPSQLSGHRHATIINIHEHP